MKKTLSGLVGSFADEVHDYYLQWIFTNPMIISQEEDQKLSNFQKVLRKFIRGFVLDFDRWEYLFPLTTASRRVVRVFQQKPYYCGSYRIDTVFDENYQQKIIETTCRFALNGYFNAGISDSFSRKYLKQHKIADYSLDRFGGFYPYLVELIGEHRKIIVLKNADGRNASRYYVPIFKELGYELVIMAPEEINERLAELNDGFVISELAIEEIELLSDAVLDRLVEMDMINDFRTVILAHDKRFYDVLGRKEIREAILRPEEIQLLDEFYVPTYRFVEGDVHWGEARNNKDQWILKHRSLGKSEDVYAGPLQSEKEWADLFARKDIDQFIIQRWIVQPRFSGIVNGVEQSDYVTGTLLYFNDQYFGPGIFRTSSCPVSNKTDDRKMFSLTLARASTSLPPSLTSLMRK